MTIGKSPSGDPGRTARPRNRPRPANPAARPHQPQQPAPEPGPELPSIGKILGEARLAAKLTVEEISADTRVRVPIIHAIEEDDFSRCGGDFYARGHIRAIARAVGVDGDPLVSRYDDAHGGAPSTARPVPIFDGERIRSERRRPNWTGAMVAAIVVVIAVIGFNLTSGKSRTPAAQAAVVPSPTVTAPTLHPQAPVSAAPKPSAVAAAPAGQVTLKISAEAGDTWLMVKDSQSKVLYQGTLAKGSSQTFNDPKQLKIVLGDGGAAHLWVNGKDLGKVGQSGQVVNATYTPGDPQAG